jgi:cytochrome c
MLAGACRGAVAALIVLAAAAASGRADPRAGEELAQRWCVACHVIGDHSTGTVLQGPPGFPAIAHSGLTTDQLQTFLSHPHGQMPDLALSRAEIDDLIDYLESLR